VQVNWYPSVKARSTRISALKTHGTGVSASFEAGYPFKFNCFVIEPQAQLVYQRICLHNAKDIATEVEFKNTESTAGRLGVRLANTWFLDQLSANQPRQLSIWLHTSIWHDFQGDSKTLFSTQLGPVGVSSDLGGSWMQGDLGLTVQLTEILSFYGTFGGNVYLNGRGQAYTAVGGLRANF
jgi:outer membrane autotransporter protein